MAHRDCDGWGLSRLAPALAEPSGEPHCLRAAPRVLGSQPFDLCVAAADIAGKPLGSGVQPVDLFPKAVQLFIAAAHSAREADDLSTTPIAVGRQLRELPLPLGQTLLGSCELRALLANLPINGLRQTYQLLVASLKLGVAGANPCEEADGLSAAPIAAGTETCNVLLPLGQTLLGSCELCALLANLAIDRLRETRQLLVTSVELGVAGANPLEEADDLSAAPIAIGRELRKLPLPLGQAPLGHLELCTLLANLAVDRLR